MGPSRRRAVRLESLLRLQNIPVVRTLRGDKELAKVRQPALETRAEDYLRKPLSTEELMGMLNAIQRQNVARGDA